MITNIKVEYKENKNTYWDLSPFNQLFIYIVFYLLIKYLQGYSQNVPVQNVLFLCWSPSLFDKYVWTEEGFATSARLNVPLC